MHTQDAFVVRYDAAGQDGLATHTDDSELSFNLLLSDPAAFEGGGTAFHRPPPREPSQRDDRAAATDGAAADAGAVGALMRDDAGSTDEDEDDLDEASSIVCTVRPERGEMLSHYGRLRHEGRPVVGGAPRYILAGFVRARPLAKLRCVR